MTNQELMDYIQTQLDRGIDLEIIKKLLVEKGWTEKEFDEALLDIVKARAEQFSTLVDNPATSPNETLPQNEDNNQN